MELAKNSGEINPHNSDLVNNRIDPDRRIDVRNKLSEIKPFNQIFDIDRRVPANIETNVKLKELTAKQKESFAKKLDWPTDKLDNCRIDQNGVIHIRCQNENLEGQRSEVGVKYIRKQIEINGVKLEGVFPKFKAKCEVTLSADEMRSANYANLCNKKMGFEKTPEGYVWHHNEEMGKMQLVDQLKHEGTPHTGGASLWGCNTGGSYSKGVHF